MNPSKKQFRIPQDPFLSRDFLSCRNSQQPLPHTATGNRRYFTFWARNALYHGLQVAGLSPGDEVLVPAYVCKVVPEAVASYGAKVQFYRVGRDCQPDFADIEAKTTKWTRALIAVHYFGFPQPISELADFCKRRELFLIEDCAHVLQSEVAGRPLGSFGNASIFSLRKFYPVFDGGELLLNPANRELNIDWRRENPLLTLKIAKDIVDQIAFNGTGLTIRIYHRLIIWFTMFKLLHKYTKSGDLKVEKTSSTFDLELINRPMSYLSRIIFNHSNTLAICAKRRDNYLFLQRELDRMSTLRFLVKALPEEVCPWVFPLFFEGAPNACATLRELGIPAVTWDGVRPAGLEWRLFPDEDFLYNSLVFLPVHQNLTIGNLQQIAHAAKLVASQSSR
jgi:perosamine synthetase